MVAIRPPPPSYGGGYRRGKAAKAISKRHDLKPAHIPTEAFPLPTLPRKTGEETRDALFLRRLHRVLDVGDGREFDVVEFAAHLIDLADVDVLDDVARLGIDRDRAARALPGHALHGGDELVAVGRAVGLLQRRVDQRHAVIAADRHEVRAQAV